MHNQYIDKLINYKLKQLKLILDPGDWYRLEQKFSEALENHIAEKLSSYEINPETSDWSEFQNLLNEAFDLQIKNILVEHKLDVEPIDWNILAASLDGQTFDQVVAQQLNELSLEIEQDDWKLFASNLDEHVLDTAIREQLDGIELETEANAWESFESRIEAEFDNQVKEKLAGIQVPPSAEDWPAMTALLDGDPLITEIREALDQIELRDGSRRDWQAMEDKLNQPLYTAFQEKLAFHAIPPLKGDWKAMEALLRGEEDPKPIFLPWYAQSRVYMTAASVLLLLILMPFWVGKDTLLKKPNRELASQEEFVNSPLPEPTHNSAEEVKQASIQKSSKTGLDKLYDRDQAKLPSSLLSSATEAVMNSFQLDFASPRPIDAQAAVKFTQPLNLKDKGIPIKTPELAKNDKKSSPKIDLTENDREGFLRSIPFHSFANPWMMSPNSHAKGLGKVSIFRRKRSRVRIGAYLGSSKTMVELSSPKPTLKKKLGSTFVGGIRTEFKVKRNISFVTGVNYEKRHLEHSYQFFPARNPEVRLAPSPSVTNPIKQFISADIEMLELPLLFRFYEESKSKLSGYVQIGLVPMISLKEKYQVWDENDLPSFEEPSSKNLLDAESQTQDWSFNTYAGNIHGALGMEYRFNNSLSLGMEPYGILSLQQTKGSGSLNLKKKMYTVGLSFSLMYGLSGK